MIKFLRRVRRVVPIVITLSIAGNFVMSIQELILFRPGEALTTMKEKTANKLQVEPKYVKRHLQEDRK